MVSSFDIANETVKDPNLILAVKREHETAHHSFFTLVAYREFNANITTRKRISDVLVMMGDV